MKTDSKILYILLGIGAGVLAYYLLCKRNNKMIAQVSEKEQEGETKTDESSAGVGKAPTSAIPTSPPKYVTPVATTTPLVVSVTNTSPTPSKAEIIKPVSSVSTTLTETKPISTTTATATPVVRPTTTTSTIKTGFDGNGIQCFEVGECLNDI
jgi:hypothetical protein